jgi:hypothetical protein
MSNSSFQMTNFHPVDGTLVMMGETQVMFSLSSAYATDVHVDLWSDEDDGSAYRQSQDALTDGSNEPSLNFAELPAAMNLHYQITVTGEEGAENTVYVSIDY